MTFSIPIIILMSTSCLLSPINHINIYSMFDANTRIDTAIYNAISQ